MIFCHPWAPIITSNVSPKFPNFDTLRPEQNGKNFEIHFFNWKLHFCFKYHPNLFRRSNWLSLGHEVTLCEEICSTEALNDDWLISSRLTCRHTVFHVVTSSNSISERGRWVLGSVPVIWKCISYVWDFASTHQLRRTYVADDLLSAPKRTKSSYFIYINIEDTVSFATNNKSYVWLNQYDVADNYCLHGRHHRLSNC